MFWIYSCNFAPPPYELLGGGNFALRAHFVPPPLDFFLYTLLIIMMMHVAMIILLILVAQDRHTTFGKCQGFLNFCFLQNHTFKIRLTNNCRHFFSQISNTISNAYLHCQQIQLLFEYYCISLATHIFSDFNNPSRKSKKVFLPIKLNLVFLNQINFTTENSIQIDKLSQKHVGYNEN